MTVCSLYGVRVFVDFEMFDQPAWRAAVVSGEDPAISLRQAKGVSRNCPEAAFLCATHNRNVFLNTDRELSASVPGQSWTVDIEDVVSFSWEGRTGAIDYRLHEAGNLQLLEFWFVHIFFPLYLTLECGYDFIHSAAVEVDDLAILFIAPSGGGKSTLADYFLRQGHPMFSDDKVATYLEDGVFWSVPSHPHHRPFRENETLGHPVDNFSTRAKPIRAIYLLDKIDPDSPVTISEVGGFRKFEQLMPNYLFGFHFLLEQRLRWLAILADQSLIFTVRRPWDLNRQREVYEAICVNARSMPGELIHK